MPKGYVCYCCGASGEDAFTNTREKLLDEIDDDYFDYERPLDFVTAAERRKLMKQAGGDEVKANELLTKGESALQGDNTSESPGESLGAPKKKKKKGKKKKKVEPSDNVDEKKDGSVVSKAKREKDTSLNPENKKDKKPKGEDDILDFLDEL